MNGSYEGKNFCKEDAVKHNQHEKYSPCKKILYSQKINTMSKNTEKIKNIENSKGSIENEAFY